MANRNTRVSKSLTQKTAALADEVAALVVALDPATTPEQAAALLPEGDVVAELPELVPDIANPEGVPPVEQVPPLENAFGHDLGELEAKLEQAAAAKGPVLHVKQGLALRGGRGEWYKLLCKYDGKPVADYIADGKANPASHYTARSTKCGQPKTPESRLSWFKRAGIVTIK